MHKTKVIIAESLFELLEEQELSNIRMSELSELSGVSIRTISRYFKGKEAIVCFYLDYIDSSSDFSDVKTTLQALMKHVLLWKNEVELVELLKKRNLLSYLYHVHMESSYYNMFKEFDDKILGEGKISRKYLIDMIVHIELSLFKTWIEEDFDLSEGEILDRFSSALALFEKLEF